MTSTQSFAEPWPTSDAPHQLTDKPRLLRVSFVGPETSCESPHRQDNERILAAAIAILQQGEDLLKALGVADFSNRVPAVFNASIGGHYRHCLDHFKSLLRGTGGDVVDYDHRDRDPRIETQPDYPLFVTRDLRERLNALTTTALAAPVHARCEASYEHGDSPMTDSSFPRKLAYCIAHAIHHFALISVMARLLDVRLPENFGSLLPPSRIWHR